MRYPSRIIPSSCVLLAGLAAGCSGSDGGDTGAGSAAGGSGGATVPALGGEPGSGGASASGGAAPQGSGGTGNTAAGGATGSGGASGSGGRTASGGASGSGGGPASGGASGSGGGPASGGLASGGSTSGGAASGGAAGGLGGSAGSEIPPGGGGTDPQTGGGANGGSDTGSGGAEPGAGGSGEAGGPAGGTAAQGGQGTCDPATAQVGYTCDSGWSATMSPYILNNNWWGTADATGQQCIWGTCQDGDTIGWVTNWDWSGGTNSVLTYSSVVFGWQWGFPVSGTGLPLQIASGKAVNCGWDYTLTQTSGAFNVAYDLWLHDTDDPPSDGGQSDEIMIWLYLQNGPVPAGSPDASDISIGGGTWTLWEGNVGWPVHSYVRSDNVTSSTLNVMDFLDDLVSRDRVSSSKYLSGVQAGIEVRNGTSSGTLTTDRFYCRIE